MKKKALILGITGQDGSYLAEFLIKKNMKYTVLKEELQHQTLVELITFLIV